MSEISKCPKTSKRCFPTKDDAESFAAELRDKYPEQVQQHAYACEYCPAWHLSALSAEAFATVTTRWPSAPTEEGRAGKYEDQKDEIAKLFHQGNDFQGISAKTGVPYGSVRYWCIKLGLYEPTSRNITTRPAALTSIEDLSNEECSLQERLREVQLRKQRLIEAKMLRIEVLNSGFLIKKEGNVLQVTFDDAEDLVAKLIDHLPNREELLARLVDSLPSPEPTMSVNEMESVQRAA
jgi:hypothetical protein